MWQRVYRPIDALSRFMAWISGVMIMLIALMQLVDIVLLNTAGSGLSFAWEYAAYLHMSAIFFGLAYTLRTGGHIQVSLLKGVSPGLFAWTSTCVGLAISTVLTFAMIRMAVNYGITGRSSGTFIDAKLVYPAAAMAFGASVLTLQLILRFFHIAFGTPVELPGHSGPSVE